MEPAATHGLGGRLRVLVVGLHHVVAADDDLADVVRAWRQRSVGGVDDAYLHPPHRLADGEHLALVGTQVERGRARGLREAVPLEDHHARELLLEGPDDLTGDRCAAGDPHPQRGQVSTCGVGVQQSDVHGRHPAEDRGAGSLDRIQDGVNIEPGHQHHGRPGAHGRVQDAGEPEHVEQRQHGDADVALLEAEQLAADGAVHEQLEVCKLGALGLPGRAAGVEQHRGVVGAGGNDVRDVDRRTEVLEALRALRWLSGASVDDVRRHAGDRLGAAMGLSGERLEGDQHLRVGVLQLICHLVRCEQGVQRHHDQAGSHGAEVGEEELRDVRQLHRDLRPGVQTEAQQVSGNQPGHVLDLGVGQGPVTDDHAWLVRVGQHRLVQHRREVEAQGRSSVLRKVGVSVGRAPGSAEGGLSGDGLAMTSWCASEVPS